MSFGVGAPGRSTSFHQFSGLNSNKGARKHCAGALGATWALETAAPEPLGARNSCSRATGRSKLLLRSHFALESAAPRATGRSKRLLRACSGATGRSKRPARACFEATVRSKTLLELASTPLCAREDCSNSLFKITVQKTWLGFTSLRYTELCSTSLREWIFSGSH